MCVRAHTHTHPKKCQYLWKKQGTRKVPASWDGDVIREVGMDGRRLTFLTFLLPKLIMKSFHTYRKLERKLQ